MEGLNKDGGISFERKKNFKDKVEEVEVNPEEPKVDIESGLDLTIKYFKSVI